MGEASRDSVPLLAKLVKVVFPVPAASSKERVFSVAGNVVTPKRANPEKVEDLVVVECNLSIKVAKEHGLH